MFYDELKSVSVTAIEQAIGKAVTDLAGAQFTCTISNMDLSGLNGARLDIFLSPRNEFDLTKSDTDPQAEI